MVSGADQFRYLTARRFLNEKRFREAFALYEEFANGGDPDCQVFAGWMCHEGLGTVKDETRALDWFQKAASAGSAEGAFYCGKYALRSKNYEEALGWFYRLAEREYGPALLWLGLVHIRGLGVSVNRKKALDYLRQSANTGNIFAKKELALMMVRGELGPPRVLLGLVQLPYFIIAGLAEAWLHGPSPKSMA